MMNGTRTDNSGLNCPALHLPTYQLLNLACGASETSQMTTGDGLYLPRPEAETPSNGVNTLSWPQVNIQPDGCAEGRGTHSSVMISLRAVMWGDPGLLRWAG